MTNSSILKAFTSWRMAVVLMLGFACGLPYPLSGATLQAWMADQKVDLTVIGIFSLVTMPYALKFLWSPLMDRYVPPFMGRRRGWILITQIGLVFSILALGYSNPVANPATVAVLAVIVAFFSASQDIVFDAYRIEALKKEEYGAGAGVYVAGYRLALILAGGGALILADRMPWSAVYTIMAACMGIGIIATIFAPQPELEGQAPKSLGEAVVIPIVEFFKRKGAIETLIFLLLYKMDVFLTMAMQTPFMLDIGFTKTDIGAVTKIFGMAATIVGTLFGGGLMMKLGLERSLWIFGIAQAVSGLTYMLLAYVGHNYPLMVAAIAIENLCSGLGIAAYSAFMMSLCDVRFTATQYALISSFMGFSRGFIQTPSGWLAKTVGWEMYFLISALIGIPGLLLLTRFKKWSLPSNTPVAK